MFLVIFDELELPNLELLPNCMAQAVDPLSGPPISSLRIKTLINHASCSQVLKKQNCRNGQFHPGLNRTKILEGVLGKAQAGFQLLEERLYLPTDRIVFDDLIDAHVYSIGHQDLYVIWCSIFKLFFHCPMDTLWESFGSVVAFLVRRFFTLFFLFAW